jgi:hypothetical protein
MPEKIMLDSLLGTDSISWIRAKSLETKSKKTQPS